MDDRERRKKERRNKVLALLPPVVGTLFILLAIAGGTLVARHIDKPTATPEPTSKVTVIPARTPGPAVRPEISSMRLTVYGEALGPDGFTAYVGDKITLTYLHNKQKVTKTVTLKNEQGNTNVVKQADLDVLGAVFRPVTDNMKEQLSINYGLEVVKVDNGKMKKAGISKGFIIQEVNDTPVKSVEQMQELVKSASTSKDPVLIVKGIYPTGKKAYFVVDLEEN